MRSIHFRLGIGFTLSCLALANAAPVRPTALRTASGGTDDPYIFVDLVPDNPGPYFGGEQVTVDVWLEGVSLPRDILLGLVRFDFLLTDPALALDPTFAFDFSSLGVENTYLVGPELPRPLILNGDFCCAPSFLRLSAEAPLHIGSIGALLPPEAGTFIIDVRNSYVPPPGFGAIITTASPPPGFPVLEFSAWRGSIRGGRLDFVVVPEPTSLALLLAGALGLGVRRSLKRGLRRHSALGHLAGRSTRKRNRAVSFGVCLAFAVLQISSSASADPGTIPSETIVVNIDSGVVSATGAGVDPVVVFSQTVERLALISCRDM